MQILAEHKKSFINLAKGVFTEFDIQQIEGGLTLLYTRTSSQTAKIFAKFEPLNEEIAEKNKKAITNEKYRELIGGERSLELTLHYKHYLSDKIKSDEHLFISLDLKEIQELINALNRDEFEIKNEEFGSLINSLDPLLFQMDKSDRIELLKIPISFLSSPISLLVIKNPFPEERDKTQKIKTYDYVSSINEKIKNYIYHLIYNELIKRMTLSLSEGISSEIELLKVYSHHLKNLILATKFCIRLNDYCFEKTCFAELDKCTTKSTFEIDFEFEDDIKGEITFFLTSFKFPYKTNQNDEKKWTINWVNENANYNLVVQQASKILRDILQLIYKQWKQQNKARESALQSAVSQIFARNYAHNIGSHVKINAGLVKQVERVNELYKNEGDAGYDPSRIQLLSIADELLKLNLTSKSNEILSVIERRVLKKYSSSLNELSGGLTAEQRKTIDDLNKNVEEKYNRIKNTYISGQDDLVEVLNVINKFKKENENTLSIDVENIFGILTYHKRMLDEYEIQRNEFISNPKMPTLNKKLFKEVLAPFIENTLLMDNLCKSEGVRYEKTEETTFNKLKIYFLFTSLKEEEKYTVKIVYPKLKSVNRIEEENDKSDFVENISIEYPNHFPYLIDINEGIEDKSLNKYIDVLKASFSEKKLQFKQESNGSSSWKPFYDVEIALPGAHPLYSILENFIRNSSKHNRKKIKEEKDGELHIFIDIREEESSYKILLYDNVSDLSEHKLIKMHESLKTSLLDEEQDYQAKNSNLGMFDKRINAHLLQSADEITNENLRKSLALYHFKRENGICRNEEEISDHFIEGVRKKIQEREKNKAIDEGSHSIALSFHIAKAKKVCWIGFQTGITEDVRDELKKEGIYFFEDISSYKEFSKNEKISVAAWEFAVLSSETLIEDKIFSMDGDSNEDSIAQNFENFALDLPFRILIEADTNAKEEVNKVLKVLTDRWRVQPTTRRFDFDAMLKKEKVRANKDYLNANYMLEWCWQNWLMRWTKDEKPGQNYCDVTLAVFPDTVSGTGKKENIWESIQEELEKVNGEGVANLFEMGNISFQLETNPSAIKDITDNQKIIMYDQHGRWSKSQSDNLELDMKNIIRNGFYEVFSKNSEDFVHIFYPPEDSFERKIFCYQLIEAGLCKVSVMDERLNAYMFKNTYANSNDHLLKESDINNLRNCDYADAANIVQLDGTNRESILKQGADRTDSTKRETKNTSARCILVDEEREDLRSIEQKIEDGLAEAFGKNYTQSDVLIIHRTFLKSEMWSKKEISCDKILNILRKYYPFVIVISGGGNPNLDGAYKYKPYNLYKDLFGDQVNKWSVIRYSMV